MLGSHKVKLYSVGTRSKLLQDQVVEVDFDGSAIRDLLKSVASSNGETLYDEVVGEDGNYRYGYSLAVNGEIFGADELDKPVPRLSEIVLIHLMQIPAGG